MVGASPSTPPPPLPRSTAISPALLGFLSSCLHTADDLSRASDLEVELRCRCSDLETSLSDLGQRLSDSIAAHASRSADARGLLASVRTGLTQFRSPACGSPRDGRSEQIVAEELPALAREVARVETVRAYAETALKLDSLIGDVEDAVFSVAGKLRAPSAVNSEEIHLTASNSLKQIEDILTSVSGSRPQWTRLVSAVDHRVDRALAVLRPQAIADHRSLLASLGWPPPLSTSNSVNSTTVKSADFTNPLFTMNKDLKTKYCNSFLSLCKLQELQSRRKSRQLEGHNLQIALRQPLWVIEELVNPISLASQRHFSKWIEKPEFIFTLVYKITRDFVDSMDEILQPMVDKARLVGYSCREEWISAMVTSLTTYLAKEIFPKYIDHLQEGDLSDVSSQARISWLHLVDLMITFDKRVQSMITNSGLSISVADEENLQRVSFLSVFCDRPDWLDIWAEIELADVLSKLKPAIEDDKIWKTKIQGTVLMSGSEDYKSAAVSGVVLQCLSAIIDRSRPLPSISLRTRFIRLAGAPIIREFLECLLRRCQEAEGLTALADDDALTKVSNSINAARYCESILTEWCEDVFFLEMETISKEGNGGSCIFEEELNALKKFRIEWVDKISTVVLRGFDARCREYIKNRKQWQEKAEEWTVSKTFLAALDYLQGKISNLEQEINGTDFVAVWRTVAGAVDQLLFSGILMSNAKFYNGGVQRFGSDMEVLFRVFAAWCLRPEGFFPRLSEALRMLKMEEKQLKDAILISKEIWLKEKGFRLITTAEAEKIIKNRVFSG
ncbi:RINT1-like protein MAG2 [Dioscorea cayenensis subsp. rotundata]|uniref:RINT1-like protein MAG2 n=1 Tax=Dioscorea cayennensis subsp. rotundata TaxID=55577 RepID=A0AB40AHT0_DIOCR|nr:RINT1-like protein MAG2 [Dioscorea cayenensis subsp. rotundata]